MSDRRAEMLEVADKLEARHEGRDFFFSLGALAALAPEAARLLREAAGDGWVYVTEDDATLPPEDESVQVAMRSSLGGKQRLDFAEWTREGRAEGDDSPPTWRNWNWHRDQSRNAVYAWRRVTPPPLPAKPEAK